MNVSDAAINDLIDDIDRIVKSFADQVGRLDRNDNVRHALRSHIREWFLAQTGRPNSDGP